MIATGEDARPAHPWRNGGRGKRSNVYAAMVRKKHRRCIMKREYRTEGEHMFFEELPQELRVDLALRRAVVAEMMRAADADALIATTNVHLLYLTGLLSDGYFYMTREGECVHFLRRPQMWEGGGIAPIKHPGEIPALLAGMGLPAPRRLMLEDELPHMEYMRLAELFPGTVAVPSILRAARRIKTPYEQTIMRSTGLWHAAALEGVPGLFKPGMTDIEFSMVIDHHFRMLGHPGIFRIAGHRMECGMGVVLAGDNAQEASPYDFALGGRGRPDFPISACGIEIAEGMTVLVDESGCDGPYLTDMTRIYSYGDLPRQAYDIHEAALEIQADFVVFAQPGARCCDLYNNAVEIARRRGLEDCFMGLAQRAKFVGHGVGLEVNEGPVIAPRDATELAPGMVMAFEPKFIVPGVGAVGVENTFLITDKGPERITPGDDAIHPLD